jgi:hypothetical protein
MPQRNYSRKLLTPTSALALAFAGTILVAGPAVAAPLTATTEAELVTAINTANTDVELDVITLGGSFTLTANLPVITESLQIIGTGNTIDGGDFTAFDVEGTTPNIDTTFTNITVSNAAYGINALASNVTVAGSAFDNAPVLVVGSGITVTVSNSSFDNAVNADGFNTDVTDSSAVTIAGSSADGNRYDGIAVEAQKSTITITSSSADSNREKGFNLGSYVGSIVTVSGSSADLNGKDGWDGAITTASTLNISSSTATNNGDNGFEIDAFDASTVTLTTLSAVDNDDQGFDTDPWSGSAITVSNSSASGNGDDGFQASSLNSGSSVTYTNLVSTNNLDKGFAIDVDGGSATGSNLTATGNVHSGLDVSSKSQGLTTVSDSSFTGTTGDFGVTLEPQEGSNLTLQRVTVTGNSRGGISVDDFGSGDGSAVTISDSTLADNTGTGLDISGAANADIVLERSTISGNSLSERAAVYALLNGDSSLTVRNSTVSGNTPDQGGFNVDPESDATATVTISHSTIVNNTSNNGSDTGGISLSSVQYSITHSIIAGNTRDGVPSDLAFDTLAAPSGSINYSLVQTSATAALAAVDAGTGNLKNAAANLGPLVDNGGLTRTHLPVDGSPVINAGNPAVSGAPDTDQRGEIRIVGVIDLGAVEIPQALAIAGLDTTPYIVGGGTLLALGGVLLFLVARRRHTAHEA